MPKVTYIAFDGTRSEVDGVEGESLMQTALDNHIKGIDGDCGGECACATCHIYVDEQWVGRVGTLEANEDQMLELTPDRNERSRLGCQIRLNDSLDGLVVHLPEHQH